MRISLIIPTLNAGKELGALLAALRAQTVPPDEIIVVDSASEDDTRSVAEAAGAIFIPIARKDFDHGGTRHMALMRSTG
ncbi:MAG: glycosyltransferase, partial [Oscillibacter sp.]|nr:glycosyltransferase [Oscillibacter sp.]